MLARRRASCARDDERVAEREVAGLLAEARRHPTASASAAGADATQGSASTAPRSAPTARRRRTGPGRRPGGRSRRRSRSITRRASASSGMSEVLSAMATTFDGATSPATCSWRSMNGGELAIGNEASGRWSKSCSARPGLWTSTIACGRGAVDERQRDRAVGGVVERSLALDDDPVAALLALLDEPLDRALREVADQPVDGDAPALDHHPGLAGRRRSGARRPAASAARRSSSATDILPIAQSVPTVRITRLPGPWRRPTDVSYRSGRPAVVDDRGRRAPRAASANSGSSPRNVCSPEWMSSPARIASEDRRAPGRGSLPPVGAMPISSPFARGLARERLVERGDDRDVEAAAHHPAIRGRCGRPWSSR